MGQVGTSWSRGTSGTRRKWSSDLSGTTGTRRRGSSWDKWNKDRGSVHLNHSACPRWGQWKIRSELLHAFIIQPPDPISDVCSLTGKYILQKYFTYRPVQIFKIIFILILQYLILRTRSCVKVLITQSGWVFHLLETTLVGLN